MKVITIGRDPSCSIVINDPQISRRHAIIKVSDLGKIEIVDLSSNGTSVNGNPLRKNVPCPVTRKNQVTFAGVSKLNWDDIPNPVRLYKWIGLGILGIIALAIIITLVFSRMSDNESIELPVTTVIQEQGTSNTATAEGEKPQTGTNKKVTPSKNNDDEVNNVLDERTVGKYRCTSLLSFSQRLVLDVVRQVYKQVGKVNTACCQADEWHDDVVYQTSHNLTESTADDDTDCHVHYVALHGKLFELFNKSHNTKI